MIKLFNFVQSWGDKMKIAKIDPGFAQYILKSDFDATSISMMKKSCFLISLYVWANVRRC